MTTISLETALGITRQALAVGRELSTAPLTIAVLDAGGHLVALQREDGASMLRPQIAIGKAWGAVALGKSSRLLAADAQQRPSFISAVNTLAHGNLGSGAGRGADSQRQGRGGRRGRYQRRYLGYRRAMRDPGRAGGRAGARRRLSLRPAHQDRAFAFFR